jgi:uncharacterized membrane protein (DUF2068 family)
VTIAGDKSPSRQLSHGEIVYGNLRSRQPSGTPSQATVSETDMKVRWLQLSRILAILNWLFALITGVSCALTLYFIRSGRFHNSNWVEPNGYAHLQECGLLLSILCAVLGVGLWRSKQWAYWIEAFVFPLKLYSAFVFIFIYAMSSDWSSLIVPLIVALEFCAAVLFVRSRERSARLLVRG